MKKKSSTTNLKQKTILAHTKLCAWNTHLISSVSHWSVMWWYQQLWYIGLTRITRPMWPHSPTSSLIIISKTVKHRWQAQNKIQWDIMGLLWIIRQTWQDIDTLSWVCVCVCMCISVCLCLLNECYHRAFWCFRSGAIVNWMISCLQPYDTHGQGRKFETHLHFPFALITYLSSLYTSNTMVNEFSSNVTKIKFVIIWSVQLAFEQFNSQSTILSWWSMSLFCSI